jgi:hypothetical protein
MKKITTWRSITTIGTSGFLAHLIFWGIDNKQYHVLIFASIGFVFYVANMCFMLLEFRNEITGVIDKTKNIVKDNIDSTNAAFAAIRKLCDEFQKIRNAKN